MEAKISCFGILLALLGFGWSALAQPVGMTLPGVYASTTAPFTSFDPATKTGNVALSNSNLTLTSTLCTNNTTCGAQSITGHSSGKYYYTAVCTTTLSGRNTGIGTINGSASLNSCGATGAACAAVFPSGNGFINGSSVGSVISGGYASGDEVDVAYDSTAKLIWWRKNHAGNWNNSGAADPATGTGGKNVSGLNATQFAAIGVAVTIGGSHDGPCTANFGAIAFTGAPSGYTGWPGP